MLSFLLHSLNPDANSVRLLAHSRITKRRIYGPLFPIWGGLKPGTAGKSQAHTPTSRPEDMATSLRVRERA